MNVLVTGGAGFMGSHIVDYLLMDGHSVSVLDDLSGGSASNVSQSADLLIGSVTDTDLVNDIFSGGKFDFVFHLAAYAAEGLSHFIRHFNYQNNLLGSINLINASVRHKIKCFVFTSSIAVYGSGQTPMTEETVPQPKDPYGISKYAVELDLQAAHNLFGLNYIVFRPHNVYGERQNIGDPYRNVIGIFMNQLMKGHPLTIFGDGEQTRAFTHISDVAPIIAGSVLDESVFNQVYNIGADQPYTVNILAEKVQQWMVRDTGVVHLPARNEVLHAFSDHSKLKKAFKHSKKSMSLDSGILRMAKWAERVGIQKSKPFDNIEIHQNLPESWKRKKD